LNGHIKTTQQRTIIQQYGDGWDATFGTARRSLPSPLLPVPNVTATHQWPVYQLHIIRCRTIITFAF